MLGAGVAVLLVAAICVSVIEGIPRALPGWRSARRSCCTPNVSWR
jgi:hypothetical protein